MQPSALLAMACSLLLAALRLAESTDVAFEQLALSLDDGCNTEGGHGGAAGGCDLSLFQLRGAKSEGSEETPVLALQLEGTGNCKEYGCAAGYKPKNPCQCNTKCRQHNNCCMDYEPTCAKTGPWKHAEPDNGVPKRLKIVNNCSSEPIWIAHSAAAEIGPDPQDVKIEPGGFHEFLTPSHLSATRYWPKMGCDRDGHNCSIGSSGGPGEGCKRNPETGEDDYSRCAPPVDTKFEATFGENGEPCNPQAPGGTQMKGCDFVDISLVDGWTLPVKFEAAGDCKTNKDEVVEAIDCSALSFDVCPAAEELTAAGLTADLRAINPSTQQVSGCYSPCAKLLDTKWSNKELTHGRRAEDDAVSPYCCPTPPQSPESCRAGPITTTQFLKAVHKNCPGVYGYAYDDGMGLMRCSSATAYTVTYFCPSELPERSDAKAP